MANQGDLIKLSNLPTGFRNGWEKIDSEGSNQSKPYWIYVCCPVFAVSCGNDKLAKHCRVYRYTGSTWEQVDNYDGGKNNGYYYFYHNCQIVDINNSNSVHTGEHHGTQHLYRFMYRMGDQDWFARPSCDFWVAVGNSANTPSNASLKANCWTVGELIKRTGHNDVTWKAGRSGNWSGVNTDWDIQAVNKWKSSNYRGSLITTADIPYMCNTDY